MCVGDMSTAEDSSVLNGGEFGGGGDRVSETSSVDLCEMTLPSEADDRESCLAEDDEPETPVKPSLRLAIPIVDNLEPMTMCSIFEGSRYL